MEQWPIYIHLPRLKYVIQVVHHVSIDNNLKTVIVQFLSSDLLMVIHPITENDRTLFPFKNTDSEQPFFTTQKSKTSTNSIKRILVLKYKVYPVSQTGKTHYIGYEDSIKSLGLGRTILFRWKSEAVLEKSWKNPFSIYPKKKQKILGKGFLTIDTKSRILPIRDFNTFVFNSIESM